MAFDSNNTEYGVITDSQVSAIISYFTDDMIFDIIESNIENKYRSYTPFLSNLVYSYETNFKEYIESYPNYKNELNNTRVETYKEIIRLLCLKHNLVFIGDEDSIDYYSVAYYLYQFLISNFHENIINFFVNYIIKEKSALFELLDINNIKKVKDSSSAYSKKVYKNNNTKLAAIHANMETILDNICEMDIDLPILLNNIYFNNRNLSIFLQNLIEDNNDFFRNFVIPTVISYKPIIITNIRLKLQEFVPNDIEDIQQTLNK